MIKDKIQQAIGSSLKAGNATEVKVLRFLLSQINYKEIDKQANLTDEEVISLFQKEYKKRKEAIEMFKKGQRNDLVKDEEKQLSVLSRYLPKQLSEKEIKKIIDEVISSIGQKGNIGQIIGIVMNKLKGQADGSLVTSLVR